MSSDDPLSIQESVDDAIGDEVIDRIFHRERRGSLSEQSYVLREYETVASLPDEPLDGWEELLVFTDRHVYRWLKMGFDSGPIVVPRSPSVLGPSTQPVLQDDLE